MRLLNLPRMRIVHDAVKNIVRRIATFTHLLLHFTSFTVSVPILSPVRLVHLSSGSTRHLIYSR